MSDVNICYLSVKCVQMTLLTDDFNISDVKCVKATFMSLA